MENTKKIAILLVIVVVLSTLIPAPIADAETWTDSDKRENTVTLKWSYNSKGGTIKITAVGAKLGWTIYGQKVGVPMGFIKCAAIKVKGYSENGRRIFKDKINLRKKKYRILVKKTWEIDLPEGIHEIKIKYRVTFVGKEGRKGREDPVSVFAFPTVYKSRVKGKIYG